MKYKEKNSKKDNFNRTHKKSNDDVRAKKHLGQHFLKDENIAQKIADTLTLNGYENVIEIGPGMGVLTKYILHKKLYLVAMDLDSDSIVYLNHTFPLQHPKLVGNLENFKVMEADFLKQNLHELFGEEQFAITGNFPYNISSQIVFKMLEYRDQVPEFTGMFQKEVAKRICEKEGNKTYGILSVLVQAFYDAEYLFSVSPQVFDPPPKVQSGVLRLTRKNSFRLACDEKLFFRVVKTAFQQRRKTLRNSLKTFNLPDNLREDTIFGLRPEQLTVEQFISLTEQIEAALN